MVTAHSNSFSNPYSSVICSRSSSYPYAPEHQLSQSLLSMYFLKDGGHMHMEPPISRPSGPIPEQDNCLCNVDKANITCDYCHKPCLTQTHLLEIQNGGTGSSKQMETTQSNGGATSNSWWADAAANNSDLRAANGNGCQNNTWCSNPT